MQLWNICTRILYLEEHAIKSKSVNIQPLTNPYNLMSP